jgi:hypothetical protein
MYALSQFSKCLATLSLPFRDGRELDGCGEVGAGVDSELRGVLPRAGPDARVEHADPGFDIPLLPVLAKSADLFH